ncbi:MAG: GNAT family N-acetyltransferase [Muribaculaceae bacterium]|nr:GNAT family N-acetyltransferase [Muribaculaceae bacterium]
MNSFFQNIPYERLRESSKLFPFDCGNSDLTDYYYHSAKKDIAKLLTVVYYLATEETTILFFTLSNDKISEIELKNGEPIYSKSFFRRIKDKFGRAKHRRDYPAVKIGRFGVNKEFRGKGQHWGSKTLDFIKEWMISDNKTGCCFITVDAYANAVEFYKKNDFLFMGEKEKSGYEKWLKENPDYKNKEISGDIPTFAMYFNLLSLVEN